MNQIYEISAGVEYHLKKLTDFTEILHEVKESLDELRHAQENRYSWELQLLRKEFNDIKRQLKRHGLPESSDYEKRLDQLKDSLGGEWPQAVPEEAICKTPGEGKERASALLDLVVAESVTEKRFLDFGCGEGQVAIVAKNRGANVSVGYDVNLSKVSPEEGVIFTDDFQAVKKSGPYDIVLLHDVLDHSTIDPIELLKQVKQVVQPQGTVYVRNHPWCSRHGGHLYDQINKAYIHLIFDEVELVRLGGYECEHNIKITKPLDTYHYWIQQAGFEIKSQIPIKETVEPYFMEHPEIFRRLQELWESEDEILPNLEIGFVEYILTPTTADTQLQMI